MGHQRGQDHPAARPLQLRAGRAGGAGLGRGACHFASGQPRRTSRRGAGRGADRQPGGAGGPQRGRAGVDHRSERVPAGSRAEVRADRNFKRQGGNAGAGIRADLRQRGLRCRLRVRGRRADHHRGGGDHREGRHADHGRRLRREAAHRHGAGAGSGAQHPRHADVPAAGLRARGQADRVRRHRHRAADVEALPVRRVPGRVSFHRSAGRQDDEGVYRRGVTI